MYKCFKETRGNSTEYNDDSNEEVRIHSKMPRNRVKSNNQGRADNMYAQLNTFLTNATFEDKIEKLQMDNPKLTIDGS